MIEKFLEKQMLLSCLKRMRLAVFTCGFLAASVGALRESAAQIKGEDSVHEGFDAMLFDPAPTPHSITDNQNQISDPSVSVRDLLPAMKDDSEPAEIVNDAVGIPAEPRNVRTLADPDKLKWSNIGADPVLPETVAPSRQGPEQIYPLPYSNMLEPMPTAEYLPFENVEANAPQWNGTDPLISNTFTPEVYAGSSNLLSPHCDSNVCNPPSRRRHRGWLKSGPDYSGTDPESLWANYPPCGCSIFGDNFGWNDARLRGGIGDPNYAALNYELNEIESSAKRDQNFELTSRSAAADDGGGVLNEPMSTHLFDAVETIRNLPKISGASFIRDPHDNAATKVPMEQVVANSTIVLHPPLIQPYRQNQYTFVVENRGDEAVSNLTIQLEVPASAKIFGALPSESLVLDHAALFRVDVVPPHSYVELHIGAISLDDSPIAFQSSVSTTSKQEFSVTQTNNSAVLQQVGSATLAGAVRPVNQPQTPNTVTKLDLPGGAAVVRNPFFDANSTMSLEKTASLQQPSASRTALRQPDPRHNPPAGSVLETPSSSVVVRFNDQSLSRSSNLRR